MPLWVVDAHGPLEVLTFAMEHGRWRLVFDQNTLDMLSISKDTELEIRTEGNALIIMPVRKGKEQEREKAFRDALKWVIEHHGETLQKLSK